MMEKIEALLNQEDATFENLVRISGLDPAVDFRGCDFRDVDFGNFSAEVIDLTNCDLRGADLSGVRGHIITDGAKVNRSPDFPTFANHSYVGHSFLSGGAEPSEVERFSRMIKKFHIPTLVPERIVERFTDNRFLSGGYNSLVEHDIISKALHHKIHDEIEKIRAYNLSSRIDTRAVVTFKSSLLTINRDALDGDRCDQIWIDILSGKSPIEVTHNYLPYPELGDGVTSNFTGEFWNTHIGPHTRDRVFHTILEVSTFYGRGRNYVVLIFSGFPPLSTKTWEKLKKHQSVFRFIILSPSNMLAGPYRARQRMKDIAPIKAVFPEDRLSKADIAKFLSRARRYEASHIHLSEQTVRDIEACEGKHVGHLKNMMIEKLNYSLRHIAEIESPQELPYYMPRVV